MAAFCTQQVRVKVPRPGWRVSLLAHVLNDRGYTHIYTVFDRWKEEVASFFLFPN